MSFALICANSFDFFSCGGDCKGSLHFSVHREFSFFLDPRTSLRMIFLRFLRNFTLHCRVHLHLQLSFVHFSVCHGILCLLNRCNEISCSQLSRIVELFFLLNDDSLVAEIIPDHMSGHLFSVLDVT